MVRAGGIGLILSPMVYFGASEEMIREERAPRRRRARNVGPVVSSPGFSGGAGLFAKDDFLASYGACQFVDRKFRFQGDGELSRK